MLNVFGSGSGGGESKELSQGNLASRLKSMLHPAKYKDEGIGSGGGIGIGIGGGWWVVGSGSGIGNYW